MKKTTIRKKKTLEQEFGGIPLDGNEQAIDSVPLREELPEEYRDSTEEETPDQRDTTTNWSAAQDRSEDLANDRDPFIQQPELDTQIPPELIQQRAYHLYEERGRNPGGDLADWLEAERQIRGEVAKKKSLD